MHRARPGLGAWAHYQYTGKTGREERRGVRKGGDRKEEKGGMGMKGGRGEVLPPYLHPSPQWRREKRDVSHSDF